MPEILTLRTLLGYRCLDAATDQPVRGGLSVTARPAGGGRESEAVRTASGAYAFGVLPGLRALAMPGPDPDPGPREFWVTITDREGRFAPALHRVAVPRGPASPPASPPADASALVDFYLFSAPARPVPPGLAAVYADVVDATAPPLPDGRPAPAAHAVVEVEANGTTHYGLADAEGRAVAVFPYPVVAVALSGSPPSGGAALGAQTWPVTARVRSQPAVLRFGPDPALPELASRFDQGLATVGGSPPGPDVAAALRFGEALVLRAGDGGPLPISPAP